MMWRIFYIFILKNSFYCVTLRLHFLFHFFVIGCGVLVARIVCYALRGRRILKHHGIILDGFFLETLSVEQKEKMEEIKGCQEDFASAQELRAYIQGYADCVQVLYHMGLLKENEGIKWDK